MFLICLDYVVRTAINHIKEKKMGEKNDSFKKYKNEKKNPDLSRSFKIIYQR